MGNGVDDNCDGVVDMTTSIDELEIPSLEVQIFPNPVRHWLQLELSLQAVGEVLIYTTTGQEVLRTPIALNQKSQQINVRQLEAGVYFLKIYSEGEVLASGKFIK